MIWLDVAGYSGEYQISDRGDIRRIGKNKRSRVIKSNVASNGTRYVTFCTNGARKTFMLHNLYADTFQVPVKTAMQIIYEGYIGNAQAKDNVRQWLLDKIAEYERLKAAGANYNDELLYLKSFLKQLKDE